MFNVLVYTFVYIASFLVFVKAIGTAPPEDIFQRTEAGQLQEIGDARRVNAQMDDWYRDHNRYWDIYRAIWLVKVVDIVYNALGTNGHGQSFHWLSIHVVSFYVLAFFLGILESTWGIICAERGYWNPLAKWFGL
ncbi:hypothetical protein FBEOM_9902 [Fusarium beomiforme]|uniref:Uncharacterized protein n=1 Tax=Fusarium beomiforme TaxID=44412 RepID=A0A9P5ACG3_9HYPO|nr:hypothetical protein FBEOM_9902 [Fusarium beomiforme]